MTLASFGHTEFPHLIWRQFNTTTKESIHILLLRHYRLIWINTSLLTGEDEVKYPKESILENLTRVSSIFLCLSLQLLLYSNDRILIYLNTQFALKKI